MKILTEKLIFNSSRKKHETENRLSIGIGEGKTNDANNTNKDQIFIHPKYSNSLNLPFPMCLLIFRVIFPQKLPGAKYDTAITIVSIGKIKKK